MSINLPFSPPYSQEYETAVSRGEVVRAEPFSAYGRRTTLGADSGILWPGGTYMLPPAAGVQMSLVSTSASDAAAGTGIRSVEVHYLDADLVTKKETVILNGTTPVLTVATNIRFIQCMHMFTYGSAKAAVGLIVASNGGQSYAEIAIGKVRCSASVRMVPAGKKLLVNTVYAGSSSGTAAATTIVELATCHFDGHDYSADSIFFPLGATSFQDGSGGVTLATPIPFTEGMVFGFRFETDKASTITGFWSGWLEDV